MFEKEAEEAGNEKIKGNYQFARCARKSYKDGFKDGAEFGYNKYDERLTKAKELLTKWVELFKPKGGNIPPTPIQVETEQFIREVEE